MKRIKYYVASSVDGTIARSDGSYDFLLDEGEHMPDFLASFGWFDTVLMGYNTYHIAEKVGVTNPYPMFKSYVFSRKLSVTPDPAVKLVSGEEAIATIQALKQEEGKDIWLCGGAELAATLLDADLVDDVIVKLNPVLSGVGIPLYKSNRKIELELTEYKHYSNSVALLQYAVKR